MVQTPNDELERAFYTEGRVALVGLDEVGRGSLAGPVTLAAVLATRDIALPEDLRDSKQLTPARRQTLAARVAALAGTAVGSASPAEIDELGMSAALGLAGRRALQGLRAATGVEPDAIILDGPHNYLGVDGVTCVVKGDATVRLLAAASVVAKVTRDAWMLRADTRYPQYDWRSNLGYASKRHLEAIAAAGPCPLHRYTWKTFASYIEHAGDRPRLEGEDSTCPELQLRGSDSCRN